MNSTTDGLPLPSEPATAVQKGRFPLTLDEGELATLAFEQPSPSQPSASELRAELARSDPASFLAQCGVFCDLPHAILASLAAAMHVQDFAAGDYLTRRGAPGDSLLVLCAGTVEVSATGDDGQRRMIGTLRAGQVLGEMALLTGENRTADALATDRVQALVLPADRFFHIVREFPEIAVVLTRLISERLGFGEHDVLSGKLFHGFRICRRLGRGGMSVVYEAVEEATGLRVALKMMSHRLACDREALLQFRFEAEIMKSLDHPNIMGLAGSFAAFGTYFIVMPYCDGSSLRVLLDSHGPLPEPEVRRILGQLAGALGRAHAAGIIHRDLKPANLMLTREGTVKLTDFGLAKSTALIGSEGALHVAGTPGYMAPEQLLAQPVDERCDWFAFGCTACELLTARRPITGCIRGYRLVRPDRWKMPDLEALPIGQELRGVLRDCLERDPNHRRLDLERVRTWGAPVSALYSERR